MPSMDEASRCPRCGEPGRLSGVRPGPRRSSTRTYVCENERCRWFQTGWVISVASDGSIPERKKGDKEYPMLTEFEKANARAILEDALERPLNPGEVD